MIAWLLLLVLASAQGVAAEPRGASPSAFAGAWAGQWQAKDSTASGPVEVIFTDGTNRGSIVAQFTFMQGAKVLTSRREGTAIDGHVRFEAPDDGEIVLRMEGPGRLVGDFGGGPTLPAEQGALELDRAR